MKLILKLNWEWILENLLKSEINQQTNKHFFSQVDSTTKKII